MFRLVEASERPAFPDPGACRDFANLELAIFSGMVQCILYMGGLGPILSG
jgi:hypothetical protein